MNSDNIYSDDKNGGGASFMRVENQVCGFARIKFFLPIVFPRGSAYTDWEAMFTNRGQAEAGVREMRTPK